MHRAHHFEPPQSRRRRLPRAGRRPRPGRAARAARRRAPGRRSARRRPRLRGDSGRRRVAAGRAPTRPAGWPASCNSAGCRVAEADDRAFDGAEPGEARRRASPPSLFARCTSAVDLCAPSRRVRARHRRRAGPGQRRRAAALGGGRRRHGRVRHRQPRPTRSRGRRCAAAWAAPCACRSSPALPPTRCWPRCGRPRCECVAAVRARRRRSRCGGLARAGRALDWRRRSGAARRSRRALRRAGDDSDGAAGGVAQRGGGRGAARLRRAAAACRRIQAEPRSS